MSKYYCTSIANKLFIPKIGFHPITYSTTGNHIPYKITLRAINAIEPNTTYRILAVMTVLIPELFKLLKR